MTQMIRTIVKWFISRSIDDHARLPHWVRERIDRDQELRHFESLARQLGSRLKRDAPAWLAMQAVQVADEASVRRPLAATRSSPPNRRRIVWAVTAGALAASVVFVLANLPGGTQQAVQPNPAVDNRQAATSPQVSSVTQRQRTQRQWLIAAWKTGRASLNQLRAHSIDLRSRLEVPQVPDFSTICEPAGIAGSIAGRTAATFDIAIRSQRQQFISDLRSAFSFFAHRLPATAAKLVGLRSNQRT